MAAPTSSSLPSTFRVPLRALSRLFKGSGLTIELLDKVDALDTPRSEGRTDGRGSGSLSSGDDEPAGSVDVSGEAGRQVEMR
jgi:hypothetical protein